MLELNRESYLPPTDLDWIRPGDGPRELTRCDAARLVIDANGALAFVGEQDAPIVTGIALLRDPLPIASTPIVESRADGVCAIVWEDEGERAALTFAPLEGGSAFEVKFDVAFRKPRRVMRDALIFSIAPQLRLAAKLNGAILEPNPRAETWLGRGTVVYGEGRGALTIPYSPDISSLQIDPTAKRLWINFDWEGDHPHVVHSRDANWDDASPVLWPADSLRQCSVRLFFGQGGPAVVRPLLAPNGAVSVFVWTEHACNCDLRTHKAVYFGDENSVGSSQAVGGFVKHRIPVTKSVFCDNATGKKMTVRDAMIDTEMVAVGSSPEFEKFLLDLHNTGDFEIIPHSIDATTSSFEAADRALEYMSRTFGSRSWIDHAVIRRDFVSGGLDGFLTFGLQQGTPYYRADLWHKYGIKYFWNHAIEYMESIPRHPAVAEGIRPQPLTSRIKHAIAQLLPDPLRRRFAHWKKLPSDPTPDPALDQLAGPLAHPTPIWWRHPSATEDFINWGTRANPAAYFRSGGGPAMRRQLDGLVQRWGVNLHHSYAPRVEAGNAALMRRPDGSFAISKEFDDTLAYMARLRDAGELYIGTVRDIVEHWLSLEQLRIEPQRDGSTVLRNTGDTPILSATFAIRATALEIVGAKIRRVGEDIIFTVDIAARAAVRVPQAS